MSIAHKDYYHILGVPRTAGSDEIKAAFRHLARRYHPDVNSSAAALFKEILMAYETLSDPVRRHDYDRMLQCAEPFFAGQQVPARSSRLPSWRDIVQDEREVWLYIGRLVWRACKRLCAPAHVAIGACCLLAILLVQVLIGPGHQWQSLPFWGAGAAHPAPRTTPPQHRPLYLYGACVRWCPPATRHGAK